MGEPNILAIIPARAGSKRLPGKNIKELDGRPLIAYSVLVAKASRLIGDVVVASDSPMIHNAINACDYFDGLHTMLPDEYTADNASLSESLKFATLEWAYYYQKHPNWVVLLQPTCPLRLPPLIDHWINQVLQDPNCDGGLTVDRDSYKLGTVNSILDPYYIPSYTPMTPKTSIKPQLRENGVFYMFRADKVLEGKPWRKEDRMLALECGEVESLANIDTQEDWDTMEWLYWKFGYDKLFRELEK